MNPLPTVLRPEFIESRVLPVVVAFGFGVLVSGIAGDLDAAQARIEARHAIEYAEQLRTQCGAQPDADAAAQHYAQLSPRYAPAHEAQP